MLKSYWSSRPEPERAAGTSDSAAVSCLPPIPHLRRSNSSPQKVKKSFLQRNLETPAQSRDRGGDKVSVPEQPVKTETFAALVHVGERPRGEQPPPTSLCMLLGRTNG